MSKKSEKPAQYCKAIICQLKKFFFKEEKSNEENCWKKNSHK